MKTEIIDLSDESKKLPYRIIEKRMMPHQDFIDKHASGTLRDNAALGFVWSIQCLSERIAYVFGYGFSAFKSHLVTFNDSISECDEKAYTLSGRMFKYYLNKKLFNEDYFEIKYVNINNEKNERVWEGIGIIVRQTSANFIPNNMLIVARVVEFNSKTQCWSEPVNFA